MQIVTAEIDVNSSVFSIIEPESVVEEQKVFGEVGPEVDDADDFPRFNILKRILVAVVECLKSNVFKFPLVRCFPELTRAM